jgi:hypothetical protein
MYEMLYQQDTHWQYSDYDIDKQGLRQVGNIALLINGWKEVSPDGDFTSKMPIFTPLALLPPHLW